MTGSTDVPPTAATLRARLADVAGPPRRRAALQALKAAAAAGVAWHLGGLLPAPLTAYAYYAALGAMLVVHPSLVDSFRATVQIVGAILLGAVLAAGVQLVGGTTAVTVAVVVAAGSALSLLPVFGAQRSWVPFAALFVLTVGGEHPTDYVVGYAGQVLLGAGVGVLVNLTVLPPTELSDLRDATERLRRRLAERLERLAARLGDDGGEPPAPEVAIDELEPALERLRASAALVRRARRGNPRARRWATARRHALARAAALERVALMVGDLTRDLVDAGAAGDGLDPAVRAAAARTLGALGEVLAARATARAADGEDDPWRRAEDAADALQEAVRAARFRDLEGQVLAGSVAVATRRCLRAFDDVPAAA
ncbi:hypothetical protein [Patulibacter sp. SYSU D01012]|uniref:hypothetical protein n=1 Tax=Patulibacter sp. SYSU D01012 TaxID=2817381 RepID=UPI001B316FA1|nr:hypothetical protein [Patulibacter sp. SYSU D01012]